METYMLKFCTDGRYHYHIFNSLKRAMIFISENCSSEEVKALSLTRINDNEEMLYD